MGSDNPASLGQGPLQRPRHEQQPLQAINGSDILHIGRKGRRKVQIGDGPVQDLDIVAVANQWAEVDRSFRNEQNEIPPERRGELNVAAYAFVCKMMQMEPKSDDDTSALSMAEALEFLKVITEEGQKLRRFFELPSSAAPSSPESTELLFST